MTWSVSGVGRLCDLFYADPPVADCENMPRCTTRSMTRAAGRSSVELMRAVALGTGNAVASEVPAAAGSVARQVHVDASLDDLVGAALAREINNSLNDVDEAEGHDLDYSAMSSAAPSDPSARPPAQGSPMSFFCAFHYIYQLYLHQNTARPPRNRSQLYLMSRSMLNQV